MPEGTLNRTFCLSKIHFFVMFWPFWHFLAKKYPKIRLYKKFCNTKLDFYFLFGGVVFEILMKMVFVELLIQLPVLFSILYFIGITCFKFIFTKILCPSWELSNYWGSNSAGLMQSDFKAQTESCLLSWLSD